jgi:hypothetical protein
VIDEATANALVDAAKSRIEPIHASQVADLLQSTGRYGSEAGELTDDVLAALHVVQHGAPLSDFPR